MLENKTGYGISTGNGVVTLNLHELIVEIGTALGLPSRRAREAAEHRRDDHADEARTSCRRRRPASRPIRVVSAWLLVGVLFLYGLAIYLARGKRRATLRNVGFGLTLVGLLMLIIRTLLGNYIVDALAAPGYSVATHHLWLIGTSILGQIGAATVLYGVIAIARSGVRRAEPPRRPAPPRSSLRP